MSQKGQEIWEELKSVLSGSTIDTLIPPIVFAIVNGILDLPIAAGIALGLALVAGIIRLLRKQPWQYALGGFLGVGIAAGLAILTDNPASYYLPAILSNALIFLAALISLLIAKPVAAWISHLTRGWPLDWFWRSDVLPAYREVTLFWLLVFAFRLALTLFLYFQGDATSLGWVNTVLGWPLTILVLIVSYVYGIWRLRKLAGPGVDEFEQNIDPPWRGQTRGF